MGVPMASARRCGGVPMAKRQMSRPAVRLEAKITPNRNVSSRAAASSGFEVIANSFRRARHEAPRDGRAGARLRRKQLIQHGRHWRHEDADDQDHLRRPIETPSRKGQDEHPRGDADRGLGQQADGEQPRVARRLEDVERAQEPEADEHRAEAAMRAAAVPVQADENRPEDEVGLLDSQPPRVAQEVGRQRDPQRSNGGRDRPEEDGDLPEVGAAGR